MTAVLGASVLQGGPYDGWAYHAPVTFSGYSGAEALTNFPALVVLTNACFGGANAFSYSQFQSGSNDLAFTDADGNSLNYEVEAWNPAGASTVWVQVPVLTSNAAVTAWWGAPGQAAQACTTNGSVWSNGYAGVWHLSEASGNAVNAARRGGDGVPSSVTQNAAGVVGGAASFDGTSAYYTCGPTHSLDGLRTWEGWVNPSNFSYYRIVIGKGYSAGYWFGLVQGSGNIRLHCVGNASQDSASAVPLNQWTHIAATYDNAAMRFYLGGRLDAERASSGALQTNLNQSARIGADYNNGSSGDLNYFFPGKMDEIRVSSVVRSSDWVWAVYQNMASNNVFQSYGATVSGSGVPLMQNIAATNVTQASACPTGLLAADGSTPASVTLYWGPTDGETTAATWAHAVSFGTNARPTPADYTTNLTGLASGTTYYYRYYAANGSGGVWASPTLSFTTLSRPAVGNGSGATGVFSSVAVLNGAVSAGTPAPSVFVCWGTADGGATTTGAWQNAVALGVQSGAFSTTLHGLLPGTAYCYRCYAVNSQGEAWSPAPATFTTATWTLNGTTLTDGNWSLAVSASGGNYTVTGCSAGSGDLDLRHTGLTITEIGGYAFNQNQQLTSLELPDTVAAIDERAFQQTLNLTRVVLSSSLQTIGQYAFCWDSGLTTVTPFLPDSVTGIGFAAFGSCTALSSPLRICNPSQSPTLSQNAFDYSAIPSADLSSVTDIGGYVFQENHSLTNVVFSPSLKAIRQYAFYKNTGLTHLTLPDSLQTIETCAFCYDSGLTTVTPFLPDTVTEIGWGAFGSCTALSSPLRICNPSQFLTLSPNSFDYSKIPSVDLSSVTNIGGYAFREIYSLTNVVFSSMLKTIGEYAFVRDSALTSLTLPASLQTIGQYAFCWDSGLTTVTPFLPDSVTEIGMSAFGACMSLSSPLRICNPSQSLTLSQYAFNYCAIPSADLSSVTNIGGYAFRETYSLTNVVFSSMLKTIGEYAFVRDSALTSLTLPASLQTIGQYAFAWDSGLRTVTPFLPDSVTDIGFAAFGSCTSLSSPLRICNPTQSPTLGQYAFDYSAIPSADLSSVTNINSYAFRESYSLTSVILSDKLMSIGAEAFRNCTGLQRVYFCGCPAALGSGVFQGLANYQMRTYIPKGRAEWQPIAASQVTALTADETTAFQTAYPGEKLPLGTWAPSGAGTVWYCSWVAPQDQHNGTVIVLK